MRWVGTLVSLLLVWGGTWGFRFLVGSQKGREEAMGLLKWSDHFFFDDVVSPTLTMLGLSGLVALWIVSPATRLFMDKWFGAKRRDFSQAFRSTEQSKARQDFRWGLEAAYRKHNVQAKPGELAELIRRIEWPSQFPRLGIWLSMSDI